MQLVNTAVMNLFIRLRSERGQDLLEYAMLGGLIAAAIVAILTAGIFTGGIEKMGSTIGDCVDFDAATTCTGGL